MSRRRWAGWACLWMLLGVRAANAETVSVKPFTLSEVRAALTHYDLTASGTTALLAQMAAFAREHAGQPAGAETAFLHTAVSADLLFVADFTGDAELRARIAQTFDVLPDALRDTLIARLQRDAHGIYEQPAQQALAGLVADDSAAMPSPPDTRSDALLLRRALRPTSNVALGEHFAALGREPCAAAVSCPAPYALFDARGRRALWAMQQVVLADQRLGQAARVGDPLALALRAPVEALRAEWSERRVTLLARLSTDVAPVLTEPELEAWPDLDGVFIVDGMQVSYMRMPSVTLASLQPPAAAPSVPAPERVLTLHDLPVYTRVVDELISAARTLRGDAAAWHVGVAVSAGTPAHVLGRVLLSLTKASGSSPRLIGRSATGDVVSAALHVLLAGVDPPPPNTDVKLRIRLGGYTLNVAENVQDIPRARDASGYHFDLDGLHKALGKRTIKSAAVSFMGDVAAEHVALALFRLPPIQRPIEFVLP